MIRSKATQRRIPGLALEDYETPFGDYIRAQMATAFHLNPVPSIVRGLEQRKEEIGEPVSVFPEISVEELGGYTGPDTPMMTADEATARASHLGLKFDQDVPVGLVDLLMERKRAEVARQSLVSRGPKGLGPGAASLGAQLLATAVDPLNVASAFVPVVGQARFMAMAGRMGVSGARVARGAAEGAVGAAIVEPLVYAQARQEQADYTMLDSLINVAFGTIMGGGLHAIGGAAADAIAGRQGRPTLQDRVNAAAPGAREAAMRTAVAQMVQGQPVKVNPVFMADPGFRSTSGARATAAQIDDALFSVSSATPITQAPAATFDLGPISKGGVYRAYTEPSPGDRVFIEGVVEELKQSSPGYRVFREQEDAPGLDVMGVKATTPEWFQRANRDAARLQKERARVEKANATRPDAEKVDAPEAPGIMSVADVERVAGKMLKGRPLGKGEGGIALEIMGEARAQRTRNAEQMLEYRASRDMERRAELDAFTAREEDPAFVNGSDNAAEAANDTGPVDDELAALIEEIEAYALDRADETLLGEADEMLMAAEDYARAARAGAVCFARNG